MSRGARRILLIRNDRLGDFVLSLPSFAMMKVNEPQSTVWALVPEYTLEIARMCRWIDEVIVDPGDAAEFQGVPPLARAIRDAGIEAMIALFSTARVGVAGTLARVPYRLAPATNIHQVFFNRRLLQRRSRSEKPEFQYNLDLVREYLREHGIARPIEPQPPYLEFDPKAREKMRADFTAERDIAPRHALVFIHPGSGGSANNLSLDQYARLAAALRSSGGHTVVITAGPGEEAAAEHIAGAISAAPHTIFHSRHGIEAFARRIDICDLFISGSTGPLHIAGALDRPTAGFYTRRRSATKLRWQTLNTPERRIAFEPSAEADPEDMGAIDIEKAAEGISERYLLRHI